MTRIEHFIIAIQVYRDATLKHKLQYNLTNTLFHLYSESYREDMAGLESSHTPTSVCFFNIWTNLVLQSIIFTNS